jgi:hypothetical protein
MASDPLAALLHLRERAERLARRDLALARAQESARHETLAMREAALLTEREGASGAEFAEWLPLGLGQRNAAQSALAHAAAQTGAAADELLASRADREAVARLLASRARAAARRRAAREQAELDDLAARLSRR